MAMQTIEIPFDQIAPGDELRVGLDRWERVEHSWSWETNAGYTNVGVKLHGLFWPMTIMSGPVTVRRR
jgi:hypothetical protein